MSNQSEIEIRELKEGDKFWWGNQAWSIHHKSDKVVEAKNEQFSNIRTFYNPETLTSSALYPYDILTWFVKVKPFSKLRKAYFPYGIRNDREKRLFIHAYMTGAMDLDLKGVDEVTEIIKELEDQLDET